MPAKYRDQAPHLVHQEDQDMWWCEDTRLVGMGPGTRPGRRYEPDPEVRKQIGLTRVREEHLRPGGHDPDERIKDMDIDGVDNIQFGVDYHHDEGTFPKSREIAERLLEPCTDEEKRKILYDNAARVYGIT